MCRERAVISQSVTDVMATGWSSLLFVLSFHHIAVCVYVSICIYLYSGLSSHIGHVLFLAVSTRSQLSLLCDIPFRHILLPAVSAYYALY